VIIGDHKIREVASLRLNPIWCRGGILEQEVDYARHEAISLSAAQTHQRSCVFLILF
jgi:hypothetical protein